MINGVNDLKMVGQSEAPGGMFARVKITGEALLQGDVTCERWSSMGTVDVRGSLISRFMKFTGEMKIAGSFSGGDLRGMGELKVSGEFRGEDVRLTGRLAVDGPIEGENLEIRGAFDCNDTVNAERVKLLMYGPSTAKEVVGSSVSIKRSRGGLLNELFRPGLQAALRTDLIEGDDVYVEYAIVDVIRGSSVKLGPGCEVGRVEYRTSYVKHAKSLVEVEQQI
ncbi:hypothetical protein [Paenibacillus sp. L3-i20]|uniref:hypothetical protein n=1 Tax=Paenibacillus sp. L3-i20 TaxID=2905833 RepID=UPI001EDF7AB4|nr:hypothetical protein [Paenibacillus sp. L3-i20]GKU77925.1 hypothetical protein L3i20_v223220 [Paenibacillus sp. L3-i20]